MLPKLAIKLTTAAITIAALTACSQNGAPNAVQPPVSASSAAAEPSAGTESSAATGVELSVIPAAVDGCHSDKPIVATVSWHSPVPGTKIIVYSPKSDTPHLFSEGGFSGSAETGAWVLPGTRFVLINTRTQSVLTTRIVTSTACGKE